MPNTNRITLVLGGARSGKSSLAEKLATKRAGETGVLYLATLQPYDEEMRERVVRHRASRPAKWRTVEAPYNLAESLLGGLQSEQLALIDCLTVWTGNLMVREGGYSMGEVLEEDLAEAAQEKAANQAKIEPDYQRLELEIMQELEEIIKAARQGSLGLIIVSNEVGMGLVPPYPLGRAYRDLLGRVNQRLASWCDEVFLVVAGIPLDLKKLAAELD